MDDKEIDKIAQAIAAKLAEPAGQQLLGCGSASSTQSYYCTNSYTCATSYECGGAGLFFCSGGQFYCRTKFNCGGYAFTCYSGYFHCDGTAYDCGGHYS